MKNNKEHPFFNNKMPLPMRLFFMGLNATFKVLSVISPKLAGKLALRFFMIPPNAPAARREQTIREQAKLSYRTINGNRIAVRVWETENTKADAPTILLSHGWAGRTTQFLAFIDPLLTEGYRIVGADVTAHGDSSGKFSNMLEASQILAEVANEFAPIEAIIGHSFGTGTMLLGLDKFGIESPKIVLIAAYSRVSFIIDLFSDVFALNQKTREAMKQAGSARFADTYGIKWDWESIAPINTVKSYQGKIMFVHDESDNEVPIEEVRELHQSQPQAKILITKGLGHRRILRDATVVDAVLAFIKSKL